MILEPMCPGKETCTHHQGNDVLGRCFGVPSQITDIPWHARCVTDLEILCMDSITPPQTHLNSTLQYNAKDDLLVDLFLFILPWTMAIQVQNKYAQTKAILILSLIYKVLNATLFNYTPSNPPLITLN